jgi:hypothetical protein
MNRIFTITTIDNPYDPFDDFTQWYMYDVEKGYNTCSKLARLSKVEDDMSSEEKDIAVEQAIDRLIEIDPLDIYQKVERME